MQKIEPLGHAPEIHENQKMVNESITINFTIDNDKYSVTLNQNDCFVSDSTFKGEPLLIADKKQGKFMFRFSIPCDSDLCVFPNAVTQVFYCEGEQYFFVPGNMVFSDEVIC